MPAIKNNIQWVLAETVKVGSTIKRNWGGISSIVLGVATAFLALKGAMAIEGAVKTLGGLRKALPTVGMAGGIGLIATGFWEIKQGNTGLGDLLISTGAGLTAASAGLGLIGGAGIGLIAYGFLQIKKGNTGLGALLIGTGAGLTAISVIGKKGALFSGAIGVLAAGFVEMKQGNTGLGAILIGTAAGIGAIGLSMKLALGPVGIVVGVVIGALVAGASYLIAKYGSLGKAWGAIWGGIKQAATDATNWVIGKLNDAIAAINNVILIADKIPGVKINTIKAIQYVGDKGKKTNSKNYDKSSVPAAAGGMENSPGGATLVGEMGPELVNLPKGANVITASETAKMLNSNNRTMGSSVISSQSNLNSSTKKLLAENKSIILQYVNQHILYGQNAVKNFSSALLNKEPLATTATTKVSQDNKNIMNNLSLSGNTYGSGMINNMTQGVKASQSNLTTTVQTLTNKVVDTFRNGFGIHSPSTVMYGMGTNLIQGLVNGMTSKDMNAFIQNWIGSITNSAGGAVSGNLVGWLTAAMAITGTPMSYLPLLENIAMHESGGNPLAINLWDSNAMAGHPSKGLMQMIDSSFSRYAIPGLGDIYNPIANAAASIRYMLGTYGSIANVPGIVSQLRGSSYVGYAGGTDNATPGPHLVGEKGPEIVNIPGGSQVIPNNKINDEVNKVRMPYHAIHNAKVENNITFRININGSGKNAKDIAKEVDRTLRKKFGEYFDDKMSTIGIQMGFGKI
ncbi:transglycosylase SLT domain-containing protein [Clostridium sp. HV4-5-A1G]|nr:transglycosylase SLT domain-containing protein [Clostridium sp. HV4-5-A1G]